MPTNLSESTIFAVCFHCVYVCAHVLALCVRACACTVCARMCKLRSFRPIPSRVPANSV